MQRARGKGVLHGPVGAQAFVARDRRPHDIEAVGEIQPAVEVFDIAAYERLRQAVDGVEQRIALEQQDAGLIERAGAVYGQKGAGVLDKCKAAFGVKGAGVPPEGGELLRREAGVGAGEQHVARLLHRRVRHGHKGAGRQGVLRLGKRVALGALMLGFPGLEGRERSQKGAGGLIFVRRAEREQQRGLDEVDLLRPVGGDERVRMRIGVHPSEQFGGVFAHLGVRVGEQLPGQRGAQGELVRDVSAAGGVDAQVGKRPGERALFLRRGAVGKRLHSAGQFCRLGKHPFAHRAWSENHAWRFSATESTTRATASAPLDRGLSAMAFRMAGACSSSAESACSSEAGVMSFCMSTSAKPIFSK